MNVEDLEEDVHAALDGAVWVKVHVREHNGEWHFTINGVPFVQPTREMVFRYLSLFFLKASVMDLPHG